MDLVEVKNIVSQVKEMLQELVLEEILTADEARLIAPVIVEQALKNSNITFAF